MKAIKIISIILMMVLFSQIVLAVEYNPVNATGWIALENGTLIKASYDMYHYYFGGWFITIIFFIFQFMLILKTRSPTLGLFTTGLMLGVGIAKEALEGVVLGFISLYAVVLIVWILTKLIINDRPNT